MRKDSRRTPAGSGMGCPRQKLGGEGLSRDGVSDWTQWHLVLAESKVKRLDASD